MTDVVDADGRASGPRSRGRKQSQVKRQLPDFSIDRSTAHLFSVFLLVGIHLVGSCMAQFVVGSCTSKCRCPLQVSADSYELGAYNLLMLFTSYAHQNVFSFTYSGPCALQLCRDAAGCYIFPQRVRPCCLREQMLSPLHHTVSSHRNLCKDLGTWNCRCYGEIPACLTPKKYVTPGFILLVMFCKPFAV